MSSRIVGLWCGAGSKALLQKVHGCRIAHLVRHRVWSQAHFLVPWGEKFDALAGELDRPFVFRCANDERIAMRDLVVYKGSKYGACAHADNLALDRSEVLLAFARLENGFERYESPRLKAYPAATWLGVSDSDEWCAPLSVEEFERRIPKRMMVDDHRAIRATTRA